jgi:predicted alpha-1,2-mannosidase
MKIKITSYLLCALLLLQINIDAQKKIDYVNPFIGTAGHGHTYPGAVYPFGMVQLSPDNGTEGWDWSSGYHYSDSVIAGFSHTHLSGTGVGDLYDISIMPTVNEKVSIKTMFSKFSHSDEKASPGYYSVLLQSSGIKAEFTVSERAGLHCYTFPASDDAIIRFDAGFRLNNNLPTDTYIEIVNDTTLIGYKRSTGWGADKMMYFAARLSKPIKARELYTDGSIRLGSNTAGSRSSKAVLHFTTKAGEVILIKVGLSSATQEGALLSLTEIAGWDFNAVRKNTEAAWEKELSKINYATDNKKDLETFYTAYYHTMLANVTFSDLKNQYLGGDGKVHTANGFKQLSIFSLWDTFRSANPLYTITHPEMVQNLIKSFLAFYDQYGLLPVWVLHGNETNCMTGYHAVPVVTDAIIKNIGGLDVNKAYEAMKKSSMQDIRGTKAYRMYGYLPQDSASYSVTITLEYAYDDWCIAQVAKRLNKTDDYNYYINRSMAYKKLFNPATGFMQGKSSDGKWLPNFDPYNSDHFQRSAIYIEGNAWQHSWFVPHDVQGMINLFGSRQAFTIKLDSLFTENSALHGANVSMDISGLIGQYAQGNEPSHHIPFLYNYAGQPWKTQYWVREIMDSLYNNTPLGLCGNEDCGQMSAWYVFAALGFYPCNPSSGQYVFCSPLMNEATINTGKGKYFTIKAINNSKQNKYIQSIKLNGKKYDKIFITHLQLQQGGLLEFVMGAKPNISLGVSPESAASSVSALVK